MIERAVTALVTFTLCAVFAAAAYAAETQTAPKRSWDQYKVLAERNIFLRDRSVPYSGGTRSHVSAPASNYPPEHYLVLKGTVKRTDAACAFLEDTRTGATSRVQAGDAVGEGRVARIALDYIEFEKNGNVAKIAIGSRLDGVAATSAGAATATPTSTGGATPATPTASSTAGSSAEAAILERLRQKRLKEMGSK